MLTLVDKPFLVQMYIAHVTTSGCSDASGKSIMTTLMGLRLNRKKTISILNPFSLRDNRSIVTCPIFFLSIVDSDMKISHHNQIEVIIGL